MSNTLECSDEKTEKRSALSKMSHSRRMPSTGFSPKRKIYFFGIIIKGRQKERKNGETLLVKEMVNGKSKNSHGKGVVVRFFGNIRKCLRTKNLTLCVSKQKVNGDLGIVEFNEVFFKECSRTELEKLPTVVPSEAVEHNVAMSFLAVHHVENASAQGTKTCIDEINSADIVDTMANNSIVGEGNDEDDDKNGRAIVSAHELSKGNREKVSLTEELAKLYKYGWYWGPISGNEADAKLISEPDGAFLVRDSSDDRYLLTLSFKSSGTLLHARLEYSGGLFSLCNHEENSGFTSVAALINHSMNHSQSAVFCYSRPRYPGQPAFPVRLTKPVSRFTQVSTLQHLCRSVIRQCTSFDNIRKLPLPMNIKNYLEMAHF